MTADATSTARQHFWYWGLPTLVVASLMAIYFTGVPWLQSIVAPHINRELGVLESLQHLTLLALVILNVQRARAQSEPLPRAMWWGISVVTLFILLEELDYGQHYIEFLRGLPPEQRSKLRSIHDGANTQRFKALSDTLEIVFFCIFAVLGERSSNAWARYFAPAKLSIGIVVAGFLLARLGHVLDNAGFGAGGALYDGIAEFREVFTYWLWFHYFRDLSGRAWPG